MPRAMTTFTYGNSPFTTASINKIRGDRHHHDDRMRGSPDLNRTLPVYYGG